MSRAFVKEDELSDAVLPDRIVSSHPNDVTAEGYDQIAAAVKAASQALAEGRAASDRPAIGNALRDLRYWQSRLASAHVVPKAPADGTVRFGSTVTLRRDDGRQQQFTIVGEDQAEPSRGTISHVSPLARALFGRAAGDNIELPNGAAIILKVE